MRRKRKSYSPSGFTLFFAFIIVVALAVVGGYFLSGLVGSFLFEAEEPVFNPSAGEPDGTSFPGPADEDDQQPASDSLTLPGLSLFRLQVNAFNDMENAVSFADKLISDGLAAQVFQIAPYYRVIGGFYLDEAAAAKDTELYMEGGYETYYAEFTVPAREINPADAKARAYFTRVFELLAGYPDMIIEATTILDSYRTGQRGKTETESALDDLSGRLEVLIGEMTGLEPPEKLARDHEAIEVSLRSLRGALLDAKLYLEREHDISGYLMARGRIMQAVKTYQLFAQ